MLGTSDAWWMSHLSQRPSVRNRAVCSKRPFLIGTFAQLGRTVRRAAHTAGVHPALVQTSVPLQKGSLEHTGPMDLLCPHGAKNVFRQSKG